MPAMLITATEKLIWRHEETNSSITYRRPTPSFIRKCQSKHNVKGRMDDAAVMMDVLEFCVISWEGIVDSTGLDVPYNSELLKQLPETYLAGFVEVLSSYSPEALELGN